MILFKFKLVDQARDGHTVALRIEDVNELNKLSKIGLGPSIENNWSSLEEYLTNSSKAKTRPDTYTRTVRLAWLYDDLPNNPPRWHTCTFHVIYTGKIRAKGGFGSQGYVSLDASWRHRLWHKYNKMTFDTLYLPDTQHDLLVVLPRDHADFAIPERPGNSESDIQETESIQSVVMRVGQQFFRKSLLSYWNDQCAVTCLSEPLLLRASHIKPWSSCRTAEERLDPYNGLLLAPQLDAAFDRGLITFSQNGGMQISSRLSPPNRAALGISPSMHLKKLDPQHEQYLKVHRSSIFIA